MKISKKDLRRIIIENVLGTSTLNEGVNLNKAWRAASNFKRSPQDADARAELERFRQKLEKHRADDDGPFRKDKGRAREAQALLDDIIALLEANPQTAESMPLTRQPPEDPEADGITGGGDDTPTGDDDTPPGIYKYDNDEYEYRVNQQTGCWEAKKPGGNWFSMKRYPDNMANLDRKFPNARSQALRDKCAASSRPSSPRSSSSATGKSALDAVFTEAEITYIPEEGMPKNVYIYQGKYSDLKDFAEAMNATLPSYLKNVDDNQGFYLYYVSDTNRVYLVDVAAFRSRGVLPQFNLKQGFNVETRTIENNEVDPTRDAGGFVKIISQLGGSSNITESLSRGSLLRRRYWGRY